MITLVLGGARSGKSALAERRAAAGGIEVTYVATARLDMADADLAQRVQTHRARRPPHWRTVEADDDLVGVLRHVDGVILLDSLGVWLAGIPGFAVDPGPLCEALVARTADSFVVSDEVGLGVHPETTVGRRFRDALGTVNRAVAEVADDVLLVVAGRVLPLGRP